jgi:FkbM family methyltransferase
MLFQKKEKEEKKMDKYIGQKLQTLAGVFHLRDFCHKIGLTEFVYRRCYQDTLRVSDLFFKENKKRIVHNLKLFTEEESKKVYKRAILYKRHHSLRERPPFCKERQYFNSLTPINQTEVLIDGGGYIGDAVLEFLKVTKGGYKKIVSFEPDTFNFQREKENLAKYKNCIALPYGLWSSRTQLHFDDNRGTGSRINRESSEGITVEVANIDGLSECEGATFIKMDIEGAELAALEGAKQTILKNRPILTICIYHSNEDMLAIPEWMANNLENYSYYCRHHSWGGEETVLYAIPKEREKKKGQ